MKEAFEDRKSNRVDGHTFSDLSLHYNSGVTYHAIEIMRYFRGGGIPHKLGFGRPKHSRSDDHCSGRPEPAHGNMLAMYGFIESPRIELQDAIDGHGILYAG